MPSILKNRVKQAKLVYRIIPSLRNPDNNEKLSKLEEVSKQSHCFFIKDHGITDNDVEELVNASLEVFNSDYKQKLTHPSKEIVPRGYSGYRTENYQTLKFQQGLDKQSEFDDFIAEYRCYIWCSHDNIYWTKSFKQIFDNYYQKNLRLGMHIMDLIKKSAGDKYFPSNIEIQEGEHNFRVLDYLGVPSKNVYRLLPHCDTGLITLLYQLPAQNGYVGLQAYINGKFVKIPAVKGLFLINFGQTINALTQSQFLPFMHQVQNPTDNFEGSGRFSIPFFFQSQGDLQIQQPPFTNFSQHYNKNGKTTYSSFVESICRASYK